MSLKVLLITVSLAAATLAADSLAAPLFPAENRLAAHQTTWMWIAGWLFAGAVQVTKPIAKKHFPKLVGSDVPTNIWVKIISVLLTVLVGVGTVILAGFTGKRQIQAFVWSAVFSQAVWQGIVGNRPIVSQAAGSEQ